MDDNSAEEGDQIQTSGKNADIHTQKSVNHRKTNKANKRTYSSTRKSNHQSQNNLKSNADGTAVLKRSKLNNFEKLSNSSNGNISAPASSLTALKNFGTLLDSTECSNVILEKGIERNGSSTNHLSNTISSPLRIKEEGSSIDLDLTNASERQSAEPKSSFIPSSEHVLIPSDPNVMQGKYSFNSAVWDSRSVEFIPCSI